jgi:hypothetical protein
MRHRIPPVAWGAGSTVLVLLVGALLPIGEVTHFGEWEAHVRSAPLWEGLSQIPYHHREATSDDEFWSYQEKNVTNAVILLAIAGFIGLAVGLGTRRRRQATEAADYRESPRGALPDGRLNPPAP